MLMLDGTFGQAQMPVCSRMLHFFVIKCVHVYPDGRLVSGSKMGPCRRIFNASVLTRPLANIHVMHRSRRYHVVSATLIRFKSTYMHDTLIFNYRYLTKKMKNVVSDALTCHSPYICIYSYQD